MAEPRSSIWTGPPYGRVFNYYESRNPSPCLIALGSYSLDAVMRQAQASLEEPFKLLAATLGCAVFHFALSGFEILYEELGRSAESDAEYLAKRDRGDHGHLVQRIGSNSGASGHWHNEKTERFDSVVGTSIVMLGTPRFVDEERAVILEQSLFVPAGVSHQVITLDAPVLNILEVVGPNALGMEDYHYE